MTHPTTPTPCLVSGVAAGNTPPIVAVDNTTPIGEGGVLC